MAILQITVLVAKSADAHHFRDIHHPADGVILSGELLYRPAACGADVALRRNTRFTTPSTDTLPAPSATKASSISPQALWSLKSPPIRPVQKPCGHRSGYETTATML